ncbi:MAG: hypothetical protein J5842_02770 [Lachnospiraceae bacterium]|nr:hypothetical protein [Lachnospiraceae bacterium]
MSTDRLKKRKKEYLKQFGIYSNAKQEDPLYTEKKALSDALAELNNKLNELDVKEAEEDEKKKIPVKDLEILSSLYRNALDRMYNLNLSSYKKAEQQKGPLKENLKNSAMAGDILAKKMAKDLAAINRFIENDQEKTIDDIFESSRINSGYELIPDENRQQDKGAQNARIRVTLKGSDGKPVKGYFTSDNHAPGDISVIEAVEYAKSKYGNKADFIDTGWMIDLYDVYRNNNPAVLSSLLDKKDRFMFDSYKNTYNALHGTKEGDRAKLISMIGKQTGQEIKEVSGPLIKKGIAAHLVFTKLDILAKNKNKWSYEEQIIMNDLKDFDVKKPAAAVEDIMNTKGFNSFINDVCKNIHMKDEHETPGISTPDKPSTSQMTNGFTTKRLEAIKLAGRQHGM